MHNHNTTTHHAEHYRLEIGFFKSLMQVVWYTVAVLLIGVHLWHGWAKTVYKMGLDTPLVGPAKALGQMLVVPLVIGFISTPWY